jgi:hypothetical protein
VWGSKMTFKTKHWMQLRIGFLGIVVLGLAGCASSADDIGASYVSPVAYENYSCQQLAREAQAVSTRAAQAAGVQNKARTSDAVVTTVGLVVFWPSLFFLKGDGQQTAELANLKGQMNAIEQASIQKNCGIQFQREPAPPGASSAPVPNKQP